MTRKPFLVFIIAISLVLLYIYLRHDNIRGPNAHLIRFAKQLNVDCFDKLTENGNSELKLGYLSGRFDMRNYKISADSKDACQQIIYQYTEGMMSGPSLFELGKCTAFLGIDGPDFCDFVRSDNMSKLQELVMKN